ncbi:hypothetical protein ACQPWW_13320 [Micromonospora sp. CA-240977]|uniref:hypothetical protein n=1 Tax=Micromonospora sp. CA-240977 TaxID=3239957 RepID=UPI003D91D818
MRRLVFADLLDNARIWFGLFAVTALTAVVTAVVAAAIETGVVVGGFVALALYAISGTMLMFGAVTAFVVLGSVAGLAVTLQQRAYALWQVIGLRPAHVRRIVLAQVAIVALAGGMSGCLIARPVLGPLFRFGFSAGTGIAGLDVKFGLLSATVVVVFVVLLALAAGAKGARRAARTEVIATLREADAPPAAMNAKRWVGGGLLLVLLSGISLSLPDTNADKLSAPLMLIGALLSGICAAWSPLLLGRLMRFWTALVPASWSSAWYLARQTTAGNLGRSAAAVNPLMVAVALVGSLYAAHDVVGRAPGSQSPPLQAGAVVFLLGGPVVLSALGATMTIFMASRTRERDVALLTATGASWATALRAAAAESLIYVGTAALLGAAVVGLIRLLGALVVGAAVVPSAETVTSMALVLFGGVVLMVPATVVPTVLALRQDAPLALSAE